ncbi:MAG: hypothetical protein OJJ55_18980 [Rhodococcus sp.]|nr:hypothetical protein [Rhodococcus sp. (in: high G+C Gram-positive bacteria)]
MATIQTDDDVKMLERERDERRGYRVRNPIQRNEIAPGAVTVTNLASGMFRATTVVSGLGLTHTGTFEKVSDKSTLLVSIAGSGYHATGGVKIGVDVSLDGVLVADSWVFMNEALSHQSFIPRIMVPFPDYLGTNFISKGEHTVTTAAWSGTVHNTDDACFVVVYEVPTL